MTDKVYKITEVVGTSSDSVEDAVQNAITRTAKTVKDLGWFEIVETRGHIEDGKVAHYQVTLRIGFTLHDGGN